MSAVTRDFLSFFHIFEEDGEIDEDDDNDVEEKGEKGKDSTRLWLESSNLFPLQRFKELVQIEMCICPNCN